MKINKKGLNSVSTLFYFINVQTFKVSECRKYSKSYSIGNSLAGCVGLRAF